MGDGPECICFVGHGIRPEVDDYPFVAAEQQLELMSGMKNKESNFNSELQ